MKCAFIDACRSLFIADINGKCFGSLGKIPESHIGAYAPHVIGVRFPCNGNLVRQLQLVLIIVYFNLNIVDAGLRNHSTPDSVVAPFYHRHGAVDIFRINGIFRPCLLRYVHRTRIRKNAIAVLCGYHRRASGHRRHHTVLCHRRHRRIVGSVCDLFYELHFGIEGTAERNLFPYVHIELRRRYLKALGIRVIETRRGRNLFCLIIFHADSRRYLIGNFPHAVIQFQRVGKLCRVPIADDIRRLPSAGGIRDHPRHLCGDNLPLCLPRQTDDVPLSLFFDPQRRPVHLVRNRLRRRSRRKRKQRNEKQRQRRRKQPFHSESKPP